VRRIYLFMLATVVGVIALLLGLTDFHGTVGWLPDDEKSAVAAIRKMGLSETSQNQFGAPAVFCPVIRRSRPDWAHHVVACRLEWLERMEPEKLELLFDELEKFPRLARISGKIYRRPDIVAQMHKRFPECEVMLQSF
jgi:hypothetical protein